ncbi:aldo/keto reductase [Galactobacter caseinivorans]|uniref:Aldo/keto reductase n=1 Tax=Galactobacter caseinivorans TaxID=2676123 RepID=A0A496PH67_9MICC|nr:aldo/keto reductase [Galactobacter caseinivorans]RKW69825.1 aldo/keto reductase [Galactobacter caseinivorans]
MSALTSPELTFNDGHTIPQLGYGVWQVKDDVAEDVVGQALNAGYRHIDTAAIYGNEAGVGRALAATNVPLDEIFVTTKVWNSEQGFEKTLAAFEVSMDKLGLETLDCYLIHWLQPQRGTYVDTWKALVELQKRGRVRTIGVCNFTAEALDELIEATGVVPAMLQIETHPYFPQNELRAYCADKGILHQSWSPLGNGTGLLDEPVLAEIAQRVDATPAQVVLAWHLQRGSVVIPKSVTSSRIVENFESVGVTLSDADMALVDGLDRGPEGRIAADPATADFA